jgi:catechol 2,3-dioxygenase-like lactoylglutathione lyase family enzyme
MLNHAAFVTHDSQRTVDFYTRVLGMDLVSSVLDDAIPSTGDPFPYLHLFFRMADGSTLAFFESPGLPPRSAPSHPAYEIFDHLAMEVGSVEELHAWHRHLVAQGVEVLGPTDHGIILSIYFRDPNGYRLELTVPLDKTWNQRGEQGYADVRLWTETKRSAIERDEDVSGELVRVIKASRTHGARK